jgi:hypothetical protein
MNAKFLTCALAALLVVGLTTAADAKEKKPGKGKKKSNTEMLSGTIASVSADKDKPQHVTLSLSLGKGKKAKTETVLADESTSVTINGQVAKASELKEGEKITVNSGAGTAKSITATDGKGKKGDKGAKKKKKA